MRRTEGSPFPENETEMTSLYPFWSAIRASAITTVLIIMLPINAETWKTLPLRDGRMICGDMLPEMIHAINPVAVLVPAHQAIFSRSAYMVDYLRDVVDADYPGKRLKDTFVSYFSGTVIVDINSGTDWHYETY